ncbi:hypothetical protein PsalN5692_03146 [Piscirickettsia salmonis]|uniref:hypothetical protein n=1 Tax=Piscirickettsia salmonis TaxID=1238 RepID=UPI0012B9AC68|nr:hypothetical protein [Piscirickettsia salmonis]QGP51659.1 hypothetical protein PsalN5692_03146 [Piscirickettsia salmonis]
MYSYHWLSIFPQVNKKSFFSGECVQIKLKENLVLNDYFWTNNDYQNIFKVSGFNCIKTHHPLGLKRKRRYLGRYFAHPMMQNRRAKRDDYKPSAVRVTQRYVP